MTNRKEGSKKAVITTKETYGEEFYQDIGAKGGRSKTSKTFRKGFGSMSEERKREVASKGGSKSIRPSAKRQEREMETQE